MRKTHTSTAVKRRYNAKAYDRFTISVKKGQKEEIQQYAQSMGMSMNGFIVNAIEDAMKKGTN
jgi:predicted HicB family RNase H-like nuclease